MSIRSAMGLLNVHFWVERQIYRVAVLLDGTIRRDWTGPLEHLVRQITLSTHSDTLVHANHTSCWHHEHSALLFFTGSRVFTSSVGLRRLTHPSFRECTPAAIFSFAAAISPTPELSVILSFCHCIGATRGVIARLSLIAQFYFITCLQHAIPGRPYW